MSARSFEGRELIAGDLLEVEAWWYIYDAEVWADYDAERDFAHDGGYFARDLRMAPVRDTTRAAAARALSWRWRSSGTPIGVASALIACTWSNSR